MSRRLRWSALAFTVTLVVGACGSGTASPSVAAPATTGASTAPATAPATAGASTAPAASASTGEQGTDDGTKLTMWTRAATEARVTALVTAYNGSHKNQVELRVVPTDDYQTTVGAAAPNGQLPDLFSADVVFMPNWTSQGLFTDLTSRIDGLPFISNVSQAHIVASTWENKKYGLPFVIDLSVWMYNKKLFTQAGLDPNKPPTTLKEFADDARAIRTKVGGSVYGTLFGGQCGGCNVFTWWPILWAEGGSVMNPEGTQSNLNSPEAKELYTTFASMWADGTIDPSSQQEAGPTWTASFPKGTIGIQPMPASLQGLATAELADADIGVAAIGGLTKGESTFVGGDSIGVSKDSKHVDQAWNFLSWMLGDTAQVEVVAKGGNVVARTDLASNKYSSADPRLVLFNQIAGKGQTPFALRFGQTYNDPQSPWVALLRAAVFDKADSAKIDQLNGDINTSLQQ
jgi:multiple sugar transport system substrate-binding protein